MPYVTRDMADYMKEKGLSAIETKSQVENRKIRQLPSATAPADSSVEVSKSSTKSSCTSLSSVPSSKKVSSVNSKSNVSKSSGVSSSNDEQNQCPAKKLSINEKWLLYTVGLLRTNVTRLQESIGAQNVEQTKDFHNYQIDFTKPLVNKTDMRHCDSVVKAFHRNKEFKDFPLCCKVYDRTKRRMDPERSNYLRILKFLARKHPGIVQTWALFHDNKKQQILVIQEFFCHDSVEKYLDGKNHNCFSERKVSEIARQLGQAMDFLGDIGISHRSISPHDIYISHRDPIRVKLGGFNSAIVYWDLKRETVCLVPCISLSQKPKEPEFQAPEVYGDAQTEAFDPIHADIWSLGASVYYMLTKKYPYDFSKENPKMENEIQQNVRNTNTSVQCQHFLSQILCTDAERRLKFDHLTSDPWIMSEMRNEKT